MNTNIEEYLKKKYGGEQSGHDFYHIIRVRNLALSLCEEGDDIEWVEKLALLHEEMDDKLQNHQQNIVDLFFQLNVPIKDHDRLIKDISSIGYKGGFNALRKSREAQIVSDADLLEAMGAIGIARTFQYNGAKKNAPLFDPELEDVTINDIKEYRNKRRNAIAHFDEKLLKLQDLMVTEKGQKYAKIRHQVMLDFLKAFYQEMAEANFVSKKIENHV